MPNYKGHLAGGAATFLLLVLASQKQYTHVLTLTQWFIFTLLGCLFPDVDIHSKGRKIFFRILIVAFIYALFLEEYITCIYIILMALLPLCVKHRGLFHNIWFIIFCSAMPIIYAQVTKTQYTYLTTWDAIFFGAGAFSHLLLDFGPIKLIKRSF
jgi:membrane-bound metal-dependent hydrolase YbcI (DUF457 family)